ncbi:MAG: 4'-phosphopantetheinyl transferase superfamily protein [Candidatus Heimdallarchaeota archaeon]
MKKVNRDFLNGTFTFDELKGYEKLKIKKKKLEWLGGRIAAKNAASYYSRLALNKIEIKKDSNNSPYYIVDGQTIDVSITHCSGMALAIAGDYGIDLEHVRQRGNALIETAFSEAEINQYDVKPNHQLEVTALWTIKEAHLKRMRIGIRINLHDVRITKLKNVRSLNQIFSEVKSPQGNSKCISQIGQSHVLTVAFNEMQGIY